MQVAPRKEVLTESAAGPLVMSSRLSRVNRHTLASACRRPSPAPQGRHECCTPLTKKISENTWCIACAGRPDYRHHEPRVGLLHPWLRARSVLRCFDGLLLLSQMNLRRSG